MVHESALAHRSSNKFFLFIVW